MCRSLLVKLYVIYSVISAACLVACCIGLLFLYATDFPMNSLTPRPITAMLYGHWLAGLVALICYALAKGQGSGGGVKKVDPLKGEPLNNRKLEIDIIFAGADELANKRTHVIIR